jgi:hypothetical protein
MNLESSSKKRGKELPSGGVARKTRERLWDSLPKCH